MSGVSGPGAGGGRDPLAALRQGLVRGEEARLRAATRLLEGTFYQEMFKAMRASLPEGGVVDASQGERIFTEMLDQHVSDAAALRSTRGIGDALYRRFVGSLHAGASAPAAPPAPPPEEV